MAPTSPRDAASAATTTTVEQRCLDAMSQMQHRGLHSAAAWLGEMLCAATPALKATRFAVGPFPLVESDTAAIKLAESYLANQEYRRCTHLLGNEPGFRAGFLGLYALWLDGEKAKDVAGAADFAATERAAALAGGGGGTFAADTGATANGGGGGANVHADVPSGLRRNHHAADLDRALSALVSFNSSNGEYAPQQHSRQAADSDASPSAASSQQQQQQQQCIDHAYLHWLHGIVRRERGFREEAATSFLFALSLEPLLWSAWVDLAGVVSTEQEVNAAVAAIFHAGRPAGFNAALGWIGVCFSALAKSELQLLGTALFEYRHLIGSETAAVPASPAPAHVDGASPSTRQSSSSTTPVPLFRNSAYLLSRLGSVHYHRKDLGASRDAFEAAIACDPFRLDGLDDFSNLLFVAGDKRRLAALAQTSYGIDAFRAETSCIAGNYFAMLRRHAQSVQHFRRAVTLNRRSSSAWTLLGHGYVEVKHTSAAVDAYNTAVEVDRRDYRAWFGLGQIFELLHLYPQALDFYRQTAAVRPHDSRMWSVVANCLERQQRYGEAVRCLERAEGCEPSTTDFYCGIVRKLAEHYSGQHRPAAVALAPGVGGENAAAAATLSGLQQNPDHVQKAVSFYTKLLHSPHSGSEDRVTAMLYLIAAGIFEAFHCLDVDARQHSVIVRLQQQQVPLTTAGMAPPPPAASSGSADGLGFDDADGDNATQRLSSQLDGAGATQPPRSQTGGGRSSGGGGASAPARNIVLPQAPAVLHFGRPQPRQVGGHNPLRAARAATLLDDAQTMLQHLHDEFDRGFNAAGTVGGGVGAALMMMPQQLATWLQAYQHDVDYLRAQQQ